MLNDTRVSSNFARAYTVFWESNVFGIVLTFIITPPFCSELGRLYNASGVRTSYSDEKYRTALNYKTIQCRAKILVFLDLYRVRMYAVGVTSSNLSTARLFTTSAPTKLQAPTRDIVSINTAVAGKKTGIYVYDLTLPSIRTGSLPRKIRKAFILIWR